FETAIVNMAVNARDAMQQQGRLTITVEPSNRIPAIRGHEERIGDWVAIAIADTGTGIAPDLLDRIFEPFYTSKGVGHGTGLGLSQVFGFAKQSGGEVVVTSELGQGAAFTLFLPREHDVAPVVAVKVSIQREAATSLSILVVEDNPEVGDFAVAALRDLGHRVVLARNARDALDRLARPVERFDVVFSDVMMPGMNGIELAHEIRRQDPAMPIILTSGYSEILSKEGAGEFELLRKPYSIDALSNAFRRVTASSAAIASI
ncbi:MAG: response regulator, partial [Lysobacteraceae bacterium]